MPIQLPPISRRRFLAGSLAAGAGMLLPRRLLADDVPVDPNRFALLADTHVWEHRDRNVMLATVMCIGLAFVGYNVYSAIDRRLGEGTLRQLLFRGVSPS